MDTLWVNNEAVCTLIEHQGSPLRGRIIHAIEKKLRARLFIPVEVPDYRNSTCEDRVAPSSKIMDTSVSCFDRTSNLLLLAIAFLCGYRRIFYRKERGLLGLGERPSKWSGIVGRFQTQTDAPPLQRTPLSQATKRSGVQPVKAVKTLRSRPIFNSEGEMDQPSRTATLTVTKSEVGFDLRL